MCWESLHNIARSLMIIRQTFPTYDFWHVLTHLSLSLLSSKFLFSFGSRSFHSYNVSNTVIIISIHPDDTPYFPNVRLFVYTLRSFIFEKCQWFVCVLKVLKILFHIARNINECCCFFTFCAYSHWTKLYLSLIVNVLC